MLPILKKQLNLNKKNKLTLLGAGPVSRNVIIACSKISKKKKDTYNDGGKQETDRNKKIISRICR